MGEFSKAVRGARRMDTIPFSDIRRVLERATQLERAGRKVLHFEIGRPDFDTPAPIKAAAIKALEAGEVHYSSNYGIPQLRAAIAEKLECDSGLHYRPEDEIIVTVGANEAVGAAFLALLDPETKSSCPIPRGSTTDGAPNCAARRRCRFHATPRTTLCLTRSWPASSRRARGCSS